MTTSAAAQRRPYRSPRRVEQAAQTRAAVLAAAASLFAERGWAATGMRDVAREAGVSVETVYAGFGSKADLLMAAIDVGVVGDVDPRPLAERPEFAALAAGRRADRIAAAARLVTDINRRTGGLHVALRQGSAGEPELAARLREGERRRRTNVAQAAALILGRPIDEADAEALWAVLGVEVYHLLTDVSGWSDAQYEQWVRREIAQHLSAATRRTAPWR
jgi:AcrR family transcriptional regulator